MFNIQFYSPLSALFKIMGISDNPLITNSNTGFFMYVQVQKTRQTRDQSTFRTLYMLPQLSPHKHMLNRTVIIFSVLGTRGLWRLLQHSSRYTKFWVENFAMQKMEQVDGVLQRSSQIISLSFRTNYWSYFCILTKLSHVSRNQIQCHCVSLYFVKYTLYGKHFQI
jgi:hypothetical protein